MQRSAPKGGRPLTNVEKYRGRKPKKPTSRPFNFRMEDKTRVALEQIALQYDCLWGGKPTIGGLLEKIGKGILIVVPAPPKKKE